MQVPHAAQGRAEPLIVRGQRPGRRDRRPAVEQHGLHREEHPVDVVDIEGEVAVALALGNTCPESAGEQRAPDELDILAERIALPVGHGIGI